MNQEQWTAVDNYFSATLLPVDEILESTLRINRQAGLPAIDVSPAQGNFLYLLAKIIGARRILEVGTLGGYSTICLARALPSDGLLVTLEAETKHAEVAQRNLDHAGVGKRVHIITGFALDSLPKVKSEYKEPFDLIFLDADKPNTPEYYRWALQLARPGTVIVADNVVRKGELANAASEDPNVIGMRTLTQLLGQDDRVEVTALQTVGVKGYDGFAIARVR